FYRDTVSARHPHGARRRVASFDGAQPTGAESGLAGLVATHLSQCWAPATLRKADIPLATLSASVWRSFQVTIFPSGKAPARWSMKARTTGGRPRRVVK